jgi:hypothetical protein
MKKFFLMFAMLALPFAMQAQTVFHDVEANEASGKVKKIESNQMGRQQIVNFSPEGKMQQEGLTDAKYDANGYLQSAKISFQGFESTVNFKWENGKLISQSLDMNGQTITTTLGYNDKGAVSSQTMNFGGQEMKMEYSDIKYDAKGNWISRKTSMMGQEIEMTRTIEYYE